MRKEMKYQTKYTLAHFRELSKSMSRTQFRKNLAAWSACERKVLDIALSYFPSKIKYWDMDSSIEAAKQCNTASQFRQQYRGAYEFCKRTGILGLVFKRADLRHTINNMTINNMTRTYNDCLECAKLCSSKNEFQTKYNTVYRAAYRKKWFKSICIVMGWTLPRKTQ